MFKIVILICALTVSPEDCTPDEAVSAFVLPEKVPFCGAGPPVPQEFLASLSGFLEGKDYYAKIVCDRDKNDQRIRD